MDSSFKKIVQPNPNMTLTTDASTKGWGAVYGEQKTGGLWSLEEQGFHINYLELKAVLLGLQSLCNNLGQRHIRVQSDNTTAVAYTARKIGFVAHLISVKGEIKYANNFDFVFDARQR